MKIRVLLASVFVLSFGAVPAIAQVCDPAHGPQAGYGVTVVVPAAPPVYSNPCAPYAWCGPRDAWGNPVYAAPAYNTYPDVYGYGYGGGAAVYEAPQPRVNGWTGAVEYRRPGPYDGLIAY